jgi:hypothetical protein
MENPPFKRDEFLDKPGIVGARWWHEGLVHSDPVGRRTALKALLIGGGVLALGVVVSKAASCSGDDSFATASKNALDMQKQYGWNFGAATETVTFDGTTIQPFNPDLVPRLSSDLAPAQVALRPYFIPTLLQSLTATPVASLAGDPAPILPLRDAIRPIRTPAMDLAYLEGAALASLFDKNLVNVTDVAVVVDLPGPESVAFAAGAIGAFDPVFLVDNWPHPRGIVPAHQTLAAALYYQPLFAKAAMARQSTPTAAPAMFVLDRDRLFPYADESVQFDNRHVARLPTPAKLKELGIHRILYVAPFDTTLPELDDLNGVFVAEAASGLTVRMLGANAFGPLSGPDATSTYYYGGTLASHQSFWVDYPWVMPPRTGVHPPNISTLGKDYVPVPRKTLFGFGPSGAPAQPGSPSFGMVNVIVAATSGAILGAAISRSGSWNRSSGGGWGG